MENLTREASAWHSEELWHGRIMSSIYKIVSVKSSYKSHFLVNVTNNPSIMDCMSVEGTIRVRE